MRCWHLFEYIFSLTSLYFIPFLWRHPENDLRYFQKEPLHVYVPLKQSIPTRHHTENLDRFNFSSLYETKFILNESPKLEISCDYFYCGLVLSRSAQFIQTYCRQIIQLNGICDSANHGSEICNTNILEDR